MNWHCSQVSDSYYPGPGAMPIVQGAGIELCFLAATGRLPYD